MFASLFLNKWVIGGLLILAVGGGIYMWGRHEGDISFQKYQDDLQAKTTLVDVLISQRDEAIATKTVEEKVTVQTKIKEVQVNVDKIVEKPIYRNVCLDDDGLRAANSALTAGASAAGIPPAEMPSPNPAK